MNIVFKTFTAIVLSAVVFSSFAQTTDRPRRGPAQEAINACTGKTEGAACSFATMSNQVLDGTCHTGPMGVFACRPKPIKAAFDACVGKKAGDACSFTGRHNNPVNGSCRVGPATEGGLACMHKANMQSGTEETAPAESTQPAQ